MTDTLDSAAHASFRDPGLPARASRGPWGSLPALLTLIVLLLAGCDTQSQVQDPDNQADSFFPLKVGQRWTYEVTESDVDTTGIAFPTRFTVSVLDERTVDGKKYFVVQNYFSPGPPLPDTMLFRTYDSSVYIRFGAGQDETLLYSFTLADSVWEVPIEYPESTYSWFGILEDSTALTARVHWYFLHPYPRAEIEAQEVFEPGTGRKEIVSLSQGYGRLVWRLK